MTLSHEDAMTNDPEYTTANATRGSVNAYYLNARDRTAKRVFAALALSLLIAGTVVVAVARSGVEVVR